MPVLRAATLADAERIAALHAAVWHQTYRQLATPAALAGLTEAHRLTHWRATLATEDATRVTWLAEHGDDLIGFVQAAAPQDPLFGGRQELKYLYVATSHARQGIGRLLLTEMARLLLRQGHRAMGLGVVAGNEAAISFYEAMGGAKVGSYIDPGPLWRSDNLLYAWDDLAELAGSASSWR